MSAYQSLISDAVALAKASSGFIILRDPATDAFAYAATENYDTTPNPYVNQKQMFLDLLADPEPRLANNAIRLNYLSPGVISTLELYHVVLVPLKKDDAAYGLLWCARHLKRGLFSKEDLARVVALVDQFHETA